MVLLLLLVFSMTWAWTAKAQTNTAAVPVYDGKEFPVTLAGTYDTTAKAGGVETRVGYFFTKNIGLEVGSGWTAGGSAFNNLSLGAIGRYPLEKIGVPKANIYARLGGAYDWNRTSIATTTTGKPTIVGVDLPCASGEVAVVVPGKTVTTYEQISGWAVYVGPGVGYRIMKNVELFAEGVHYFREGPDTWKVSAGVTYFFGVNH